MNISKYIGYRTQLSVIYRVFMVVLVRYDGSSLRRLVAFLHRKKHTQYFGKSIVVQW